MNATCGGTQSRLNTAVKNGKCDLLCVLCLNNMQCNSLQETMAKCGRTNVWIFSSNGMAGNAYIPI